MIKDDKYKIGYVDESESDIHEFQNIFEKYFDIIPYVPNKSTAIDDILSWINDKYLDLIIVDFDLKEHFSVDFYGTKILEALNEKYLNFPMFMFTGFEDIAINESNGLINDLTYEKEFVTDNVEIMAARITNKIEKYKASLEEALQTHTELLMKDKLTLDEEDKLLKLDSFLEKSYGKEQSQLQILKSSEYLEKLNLLVDKADMLLREIDQNE